MTTIVDTRESFYRTMLPKAIGFVAGRRARYDAEVDDWYTNGDGRSTDEGGMGHRYPVCIHGRSLWSDFDVPCGHCEAGDTDQEVAEGIAWSHALRLTQRLDWFVTAPQDLPTPIREAISEWLAEAMEIE